MKKCKVCGRNAQSDYCFAHKPRIPIKKTKIRLGTGSYKQAKIRDEYNALCDVFNLVWKERPHKSEVSGTYLGAELSTVYLHHILPKGKYPQAAVDKENIILLTFDEHTNVENDMYKYEEINRRRETLKRKYNL